MLVLSRKKSQSVQIDSTIQITVVSTSKGRVKLGITAPDNVRIIRHELIDCVPITSGTQERTWPAPAKLIKVAQRVREAIG